MPNPTGPLKSIASGYRALFRRIGGGVLFICAALAASAALVYPLWYLAMNHRDLYNIIFLAVVAFSVLFLVARHIAGKRMQPPRLRRGALKRVVIVLVGLLAAWGILLLFLAGKPLAGAVATGFAFILIGYLAYAKKR